MNDDGKFKHQKSTHESVRPSLSKNKRKRRLKQYFMRAREIMSGTSFDRRKVSGMNE